ncbi:MAG: hypothetical protein P1V81_07120 [Planctomycetota bacterium]|nr:hypothetical protein [Planctomycetota bacterium]
MKYGVVVIAVFVGIALLLVVNRSAMDGDGLPLASLEGGQDVSHQTRVGASDTDESQRTAAVELSGQHSTPPQPSGVEATRLIALDESGVPMDGVLVVALRGAEARTLGETASGGVLDLTGLWLGDSLSLSGSDVIVTRLSSERFERPGLVECILARDAKVDGHVVLRSNGQPAGAGIRVVAWPSTNPSANPLELGLVAQGVAAMPQTATDEFGRFSLGGLDPGKSYSLLAAGKGRLSSAVVSPVLPGTREDVEIEVGSVFGLYFAFESDRGEVERQLRWSQGEKGTQFLSLSGNPDATAVVVDDSIARLVGASLPPGNNILSLVVYYSELESDRIGPVTIHTRFPGYPAQSFDVYAERLMEDFEPTRLDLGSPIKSFGSLALEVEGLPLLAGRVDRGLHAGVLRLVSEGGDSLDIDCDFSMLSPGTEFGGIPTGQYHATFKGNKGFFEASLAKSYAQGEEYPIRVRAGEMSSVHLDFSSAAIVGLELFNGIGEVERRHVGFLPRKIMPPGSGNQFRTKGTITSRFLEGDQIPAILLAPGKYRFDPVVRSISLYPPADLGADGAFHHPLVLDLDAGEEMAMVWQVIAK